MLSYFGEFILFISAYCVPGDFNLYISKTQFAGKLGNPVLYDLRRNGWLIPISLAFTDLAVPKQ